MTHKELVNIGYRWFKNRGYGLILGEFVCGASEIPDVIAFQSNWSAVIECKTSRADFNADKKKWFRYNDNGMGVFRYYLTPKGVIRPEELPDKWGLIETTGKRSKVVVDSGHHNRSFKHENSLLYSICRRIEIRGLLEHALAGQALELHKAEDLL